VSATPEERRARLADAPMEPVEGTVDIDVPIDKLWPLFARANLWSHWNRCFFWAWNRQLRRGAKLIWFFQPIRWFWPYKMFAVADIVELEGQGSRRKVTWEVTALPGFFARHTYHAEDLGDGRTRFGSWEKACGPSFERMRRFWIAHFKFVCEESLAGARRLSGLAQARGALTEPAVRRMGLAGRSARGLALALVLLAVGAGAWFHRSFVRLHARELAPGVTAVFGGGGNALVVDGGDEVLIVDAKFPPGSLALRDWVATHTRGRVTYVVDTHYHYDHATGNDLYPGATLIAHQRVPALMRANDGALWADHPQGIPGGALAVGDDAPVQLQIGAHQVVVFHPGFAHTHADVCVYLPHEDILATGDLLFFTYYPFFDLRPGGADLAGLVVADRRLASQHSTATVVPGHGPIASASDLARYADYIQQLSEEIRARIQRGMPEPEIARSIDLARWSLSTLPSFHDGQLSWATARSNIRDVYALVKRDLDASNGTGKGTATANTNQPHATPANPPGSPFHAAD
jgi:glyoxylase-like metal-dependent hydrolase (beta-lactamase superfamily II)